MATKRMGEALSQIFEAFSHEYSMIHAKWGLYRQLYGKDEQTIELLNRFAPFAFGMLERIMWHDTILSITRMMDRSQTQGRDNASLARLLELVEADDQPALAARLEALREELISLTADLKGYCDRRLSHNDLEVFLNLKNGRDILSGISRADIEMILARMREIMNEIQRKYQDAETYYRGLVTAHTGDFEALTAALRELERHRQAAHATGA